MGNGIRRSEDLRAEIEKYSNSTNERKQMSIKTIKQRIALVAVTALTAGMFTVVSAPVANAAIGGNQNHGSLMIDIDAPVGTANAAVSVTLGGGTSRGWVSDTSTTLAMTSGSGTSLATSINAGQAKTGTILPGAKLSFQASTLSTADGATSDGVSIVVTGGTLSDMTATTTNIRGDTSVATSLLLAGDLKAASILAPAVSTTLNKFEQLTMAGLFTASSTVGTVATIAAYSGIGINSTDTRTSGSLLGIWTLTVVAASAGGSYDATNSTVTQQACVAKTSAASGTNAFETTSRCANGRNGVIYAAIKDAYGAVVTSGTLTATATGGSLVTVQNSTPTAGDNYSPSAAFSSVTPGANNYITVTQPVANTAGSSTVTLTHNGVTIGTKTINWAGDAATIVVDTASSATIIRNGTNDATSARPQLGTVFYAVKDAAGNVISTTTRPTISNDTGSMVGATISTTTAAGATQGVLTQSLSLGYGVDNINLPSSSQAANRGAGSYKLKWLKADGTPIYSQEVKVTVSYSATGLPYTFAASWDKSSYVPGEIAELTIALKDAYGNSMADQTFLTGVVIITGSNNTTVGGECTAASSTTKGVKVCKFSIGNTAGSYAYSVALTTDTAQSAVVGTLKVTDGAVSNAEVLKSIVALIASINKQIAALQKLILKR